MTKRENALIAYHHGIPAFIPTSFTDIAIIQARPQMERYCGVDVGFDEFGVEWTFVPRSFYRGVMAFAGAALALLAWMWIERRKPDPASPQQR